MEKPFDGGEVDVEGLAAIIVNERHKVLLEVIGQRLDQGMQEVNRLRDCYLDFR